MNYAHKLILVVAVCMNIQEAYSFGSKQTTAQDVASHMKSDAKELNKITKKTISRLQKRLAKTKKRHEKLLKKLIAKNVSRADREKNRDVVILKREIEHITNELDTLSRN